MFDRAGEIAVGDGDRGVVCVADHIVGGALCAETLDRVAALALTLLFTFARTARGDKTDDGSRLVGRGEPLDPAVEVRPPARSK